MENNLDSNTKRIFEQDKKRYDLLKDQRPEIIIYDVEKYIEEDVRKWIDFFVLTDTSIIKNSIVSHTYKSWTSTEMLIIYAYETDGDFGHKIDKITLWSPIILVDEEGNNIIENHDQIYNHLDAKEYISPKQIPKEFSNFSICKKGLVSTHKINDDLSNNYCVSQNTNKQLIKRGYTK